MAVAGPQQSEPNRCFMCVGSRKAAARGVDARAPAIWISRGTGRDGQARRDAPKVGWCWAGNNHAWLDSPRPPAATDLPATSPSRRGVATSDCYNAATSATAATSEVLTAPPASVPPRAPVTADVPRAAPRPLRWSSATRPGRRWVGLPSRRRRIRWRRWRRWDRQGRWVGRPGVGATVAAGWPELARTPRRE